MKHRVWVYLYQPELKFLMSLGELIGTNSQHEQIEFIIRLCRLMVPEAKIIPIIMSNIGALQPIMPRIGPAVRAWVYLSEDDLWYLDEFMVSFNLTSRSKAIRYLIHITKLLLLKVDVVTKEVSKLLKY